MLIEKTPLEGLLLIQPDVYADARGFFYECYNEVKFREAGLDLHWMQDNHAMSVRGTVRGLHFQHAPGQAKLVRCTRGRVWDVAVDIRPGSPTLGQWFADELSDENKTMLFIPVGFAHGYAVLSEEAEFQYKCTNIYDPKIEDGIRWNDPELGVPWPVAAPVLSVRDEQTQSFREYLAKVAGGEIVLE